MAYVVVSIGGEEVSRHPVSGPAVIGRSVDADISVRDASMSRWHCRIEPEVVGGEGGGAWTITDLGSRNGTSVNGRRAVKQALHSGDLLRIGRVNVSFSTGDFVPADALPALSGSAARGQREPSPGLSGVIRAGGGAGSAGGSGSWDALSRLPKPDPTKPGERRATAAEMEMMSSPGWSSKVRPHPSPSVDMSSGELSERENTKTVDIAHLDPGTRARPEKKVGLWARIKALFVGR